MQEIGKITRVQVQQSPLKSGEGANRMYQPTPILEVAKLILTPDGATGITAAGQPIIDAHNARHPQTRNTGSNGLSLGFSHNYVAMRERFGEHLRDGVAGENILVTAFDSATLPDITDGKLAIRTADGTLVEFISAVSAPPCEPFSRFCAGRKLEAPEMKATLQYLDEGRRGYYLELVARHGQFTIQPGDVLVLQ